MRLPNLELVILGKGEDLLHGAVFLKDNRERLECDRIDHVLDGDMQNRFLAGASSAESVAV